MYGNVKLGTELISTREAANELGLDFVNPNNQSTYNITIEGTTNYGLFSMLGMGYTFDNSSAPSFEIKYDETLTKDVFLYYFDQSNENILDNYRYAYIDNLTDQTIQFEKMSLPQIDNIFTLDVPETVKRAGITLLGYANEDEYRENFFSILFGNSIETGSSGFSISYPDVKEYPIIVKSISLDFLDGSQMTFVQKGTPDITKPNITVQKNKDVIQINGEHDFSKLELEIAHPDTQKDDVFRMTYKNQSLGAINLPFETFEIPEEIVQIVNTSGLGINTRNNSGIMKLRIEKYQNKTFPNGVFYVPLRKEFGDEFYWSMPIKD